MQNNFLAIALLLAVLVVSGCSEPLSPDGQQSPQLTKAEQVSAGVKSKPTDLAAIKQGQILFVARCALCHGASGLGSKRGPALIHHIYRPAHHADYSIERAVKFGVRSHHWGFGDMPPIANLAAADIHNLTTYIRSQQRKAGIQ